MYRAVVVVAVVVVIIWYLQPRDIFSSMYFDANATTPMSKATLKIYDNATRLGNGSAYYAGKSKTVISDAEKLICSWTGTCKDDFHIIFNSGASESNNFVLRSLTESHPHFILSAIEHKASLYAVEHLQERGLITYTLIEPHNGYITAERVLAAIRPETRLVSVMHANNETGAINDLISIGKALEVRPDIIFHSDCVQTFGKLRTPIRSARLDAISVSAHKLYGPLGCGFLLMSDRLAKITKGCEQISGTQFASIRGGTENLPGIAAFSNAMSETWHGRLQKNNRLNAMRVQLIHLLGQQLSRLHASDMDGETHNQGGFVVITPSNSLPNTLLLSFILPVRKFCNIKLREALLKRGIIISISSACNTNLAGASHVLHAMKMPRVIRSGVIRISLHDGNTPAEIDRLAVAILEEYDFQKNRNISHH